MSIYAEGKRKLVGVRLTGFQQERLDAICKTFGISGQRLFTDLLDEFYCDYWSTLRGTQSIRSTVKESAQRCLDDMVKLNEVKGIVRPQYPPEAIPQYPLGESPEL
jgi:hypothetical protein